MIRTDSRKVLPGDTFVALPGISSNGDQYIEKAIRAGAKKVICREGDYPVETIHTDDPRAFLEEMLVREYGSIVSQMTLIALTGTNGKTTTCYLIAQALNKAGRKCAYIGTIGFYLGEKVKDLPNTSVDICDLYELLLEAHDRGFDTVALEASSQGLDMGRLHTLSSDIAVFTNLTEDHLDYHKTMENYASAKQRLFRNLKPSGAALVNIDDPGSSWFLLDQNTNYTYGIENGDFRAECFSFKDGTEIKFTVPSDRDNRGTFEAPGNNGQKRRYTVHTGLVGRYNVYNTLAVIGVLWILGYNAEEITKILDGLRAPDGRFDLIGYRGSNIVIDYAHTPDAVENVLQTAREFTRGKTYVVFGCTGDREREKRPVMTQIVLQNCTRAVITDDDVHSEPEEQIVKDMLQGNTCTNYEICLDRKEAIRRGISMLQEGDTLLILGKGHETAIIMDGYSIPHNDRQEVLKYTEKV